MSDSTPSWTGTRRFGIGLTASVAVFCAWGALAPHIPAVANASTQAAGLLLAAFYATAQGLANCSAANTRRAWTRGKGYRWPAAFFFSCFIGFALMSMSGLHAALAFAVTHSGGAPMPDSGLMKALFVFVAFSEPAINYGVEALKTMHEDETRAADQAALAAAAEREILQRDAEARRKSRLQMTAPAAAAAVATAAVGAAGGTAEKFPLDPISHSAPAAADHEAHAAHGWRGPRDPLKWERFMEAHALGLSPTEIINRSGVAPTTVYRWRQHLRNGVAGATATNVAGPA
jgi:hypothetical protein